MMSALVVHHSMVGEGEDTPLPWQGGAQGGASPADLSFTLSQGGQQEKHKESVHGEQCKSEIFWSYIVW